MIGAATAAPGGDIAWPKVPAKEGRDFGVRAIMLLLTDRGRGFGVFIRFCACESGSFLTVDTGRDTEVDLLGVATGVPTFALMLLLPGTVMESLLVARLNRCGVAGRTAEPSLVVGLLFGLLELDMAEAGRSGGGMELSALKKLDLRLAFPPAGEGGTCDKLSMVLSESDGRLFFLATLWGSGSFSSAHSSSWSRCPALELARDDALDAERKPSKLPNASSSLLVLDEGLGCGGAFVWPEGARAKGFLKTGALLVAVGIRGWPMLGIPLVRREEKARDVLLECEAAGAAGVGALEGTRDSLDVFLCRADTGWGWLGLDMDDSEGFLRSCSVDEGVRSCD